MARTNGVSLHSQSAQESIGSLVHMGSRVLEEHAANSALVGTSTVPTGTDFRKRAWEHASPETRLVAHAGRDTPVDMGSPRDLSIADILVLVASRGINFTSEMADRLGGSSSGSVFGKIQRALAISEHIAKVHNAAFDDEDMAFYFKSSFFAASLVTVDTLKALAGKQGSAFAKLRLVS